MKEIEKEILELLDIIDSGGAIPRNFEALAELQKKLNAFVVNSKK